nr:MAG TPA_asm: hypothetical protein [Caudoviricetes sp.]
MIMTHCNATLIDGRVGGKRAPNSHEPSALIMLQ